MLTLLVATVFQSNAQTSIPFYGFELSNYEVGDSLLYSTHRQFVVSGGTCNGKKLFVILDKVQTSPDTVKYTVKQLYRFYCSGAPQPTEGADTVFIAVSNDTVVNNNNNLLTEELTVANDVWLSTILVFDTVQGLKHLNVDVGGFEFVCEYDALQNVGLTTYKRSEGGMEINTHSLLYARLQHYGMYGEYDELVLSAPAVNQAIQPLEYDVLNKTLTVKNETTNRASLRLYDEIGRCVLTAQPNAKTISLNHLTHGIYFYQFVGEQTATGKILVR